MIAPQRASSRLASMPNAAGAVCVEVLQPLVNLDWRAINAADLDWSAWDTIVHLNDCLYFYAAQILLAKEDDYVCFALTADKHADPQRQLEALAIHSRLLAQTASTADPAGRGFHVQGVSDPVGFAAMGVVELLIHTYDAVHGLDPASSWRPPDDLAAPVLARLFPHAPDIDAAPSDVFLYMCGRTALGDRPRQTDWRWYGAPGAVPAG